MKKLNLVKVAGVLFVSSVVFMGCPQEVEPYHFRGNIGKINLPKGTGAQIPAWTKADSTYNLPDVVTDLSLKYDDLNNLQPGYKTNRTEELRNAMKDAQEKDFFKNHTPKNVIYVFGDGMGESHLQGGRYYYGDLFGEELVVDLVDRYYSSDTRSYNKPANDDTCSTADIAKESDKKGLTITDSSAGGTALTTGYKTRYGLIGLDRDGNVVKNLSELARENGMLVGNVTNDHMADATPSATYVHDTNRDHQDLLYFKEFLFAGDIQFGSDYGYSTWIDSDDFELTVLKQDDEALQFAIDAFNKDASDESKKFDSIYKAWETANSSKTDLEKLQHKYEILKDYIDPTNTKCVAAYKPYSVKAYWESIKDDFMGGNNPSKAAITNMNDYAATMKFKGYNNFPAMVTGESEKFENKATGTGWSGTSGGYTLKGTSYPNWAEMVAWTLTDLDHKSKANGDCGFFCLIENTCSDGWGHDQKPIQAFREIQCYDEGVAIAIKYALENPDTLIVFTADHETGQIEFGTGWEDDVKKAKSKSSGHSSIYVPCAAFGAGADLWPKRADGRVATNDYTGQLVGKALLMGRGKTGDDTKFGNVDGYAVDPYPYKEGKFIK